VQRRNQPEENAGERREQQGEGEHPPITVMPEPSTPMRGMFQDSRPIERGRQSNPKSNPIFRL
jgi:hypothetical protein